MNKIYLTEEEKKEILNIQSQENDYMVQLGQIEYQIQSLNSQEDNVKVELQSFEERKIKLAKQLQDSYGEGSINIETGEFIKSN